MAEESKQAEDNQSQLALTTFKGEDILKTKTAEELQALKEEIMAKADAWTHYTDLKDEDRAENASSWGGFSLQSAEHTALLRSAGTEIITVSRDVCEDRWMAYRACPLCFRKLAKRC